MTDEELRELITKKLVGRVTPISSPAVLSEISTSKVDYERGREIIWQMVMEGLIIHKHIRVPGKGLDHINVYKWANNQ